MGGGYYESRIPTRVRENTTEYFRQTRVMATKPPEERRCHKTLDPNGVVRECCNTKEHPNTTPIVVALDHTESRGDDTKIICQKLPSMIGQIGLNAYVTDPEIMIMGIGDATTDAAPIQVGQFESDSRIDENLRDLWIEKGGGGTGQESYQLGALFLARCTKLECLKRGQKGVVFFLGDEGFYPTISASEASRVLGLRLQEDIPSAQVFRELQKMYDVFFIYPQGSWKERQKNIDSEIAQRVKRAGGRVEGVDVRFSLAWDDYDDLDLHVQTPKGEHIYYASKRSSCGGELDVDMNAGGPQSQKPVENTRWPKGQAPSGTYTVWVERYAFHKSGMGASSFRVEVQIGGKTETFEGMAKANTTHRRIPVGPGEFTFDPSKTADTGAPDRYALYDDKVVKAQWASAIPSEHILLIKNPKACVDIMLGVLALRSGKRNLDGYAHDLVVKEQTQDRIAEVRAALADYAKIVAAPQATVSTQNLKSGSSTRRASTSSRRL